jgi:hypothetical protein
MDDDDLIKVALRAALDHILELDGDEPLSDAEWEERPEADPALFAALVSAGRAALTTARSHEAEIAQDIPTRHLRVAHAAKRGQVRVQHIPTGAVVELKHITPQVNAALAMRMVRAAFE